MPAGNVPLLVLACGFGFLFDFAKDSRNLAKGGCDLALEAGKPGLCAHGPRLDVLVLVAQRFGGFRHGLQRFLEDAALLALGPHLRFKTLDRIFAGEVLLLKVADAGMGRAKFPPIIFRLL